VLIPSWTYSVPLELPLRAALGSDTAKDWLTQRAPLRLPPTRHASSQPLGYFILHPPILPPCNTFSTWSATLVSGDPSLVRIPARDKYSVRTSLAPLRLPVPV